MVGPEAHARWSTWLGPPGQWVSGPPPGGPWLPLVAPTPLINVLDVDICLSVVPGQSASRCMRGGAGSPCQVEHLAGTAAGESHRKRQRAMLLLSRSDHIVRNCNIDVTVPLTALDT